MLKWLGDVLRFIHSILHRSLMSTLSTQKTKSKTSRIGDGITRLHTEMPTALLESKTAVPYPLASQHRSLCRPIYYAEACAGALRSHKLDLNVNTSYHSEWELYLAKERGSDDGHPTREGPRGTVHKTCTNAKVPTPLRYGAPW